MRRHACLALAAATALVAGCATPAFVSPVEVTRFVGDSPSALGSGTIAVRAAPGQPESFDLPAFQSAVAAELAALGYSVTDADAAQVAEVRVERFTSRADGGRSPVGVGVGGSTGSWGSGVGVGVGINLGGRPADRIQTEMRVMIRPAAGANALWEGRARFTASTNSDYAGGQASAARMADALFTGFPGRSGETIEVR